MQNNHLLKKRLTVFEKISFQNEDINENNTNCKSSVQKLTPFQIVKFIKLKFSFLLIIILNLYQCRNSLIYLISA